MTDEARTAPQQTDAFASDLSDFRDKIQSHVEQIWAEAHEEIARVKSSHESEKADLEREINRLKQRVNEQNDKLSALQTQVRSLLEEYRSELEERVSEADSARAQIDRLQQAMGAVEEVRFDEKEEITHPTPEGEPDELESSPGSTRISISGISSVSAMMRARKAVQDLPSVNEVESRYVADGTLYLSVRTEAEPDDLARDLTSLPDPQLRLLRTGERSVELEM